MKRTNERQERFIVSLRAELGDESTDMPLSSLAASGLIRSLLLRKETAARERERAASGARLATSELQRSIRAMASRLGVEVQPSWLTDAEARFVLDDLRHRVRRAMRTADGSVR